MNTVVNIHLRCAKERPRNASLVKKYSESSKTKPLSSTGRKHTQAKKAMATGRPYRISGDSVGAGARDALRLSRLRPWRLMPVTGVSPLGRPSAPALRCPGDDNFADRFASFE